MADDKIEIKNVLQPGKTYRVDAAKFQAASDALLKALPPAAPGLTQAEMTHALRQTLSAEQFPGTTSSWWMQSAQLHLEAEGRIVRDKGKPLRWRRAE